MSALTIQALPLVAPLRAVEISEKFTVLEAKITEASLEILVDHRGLSKGELKVYSDGLVDPEYGELQLDIILSLEAEESETREQTKYTINLEPVGKLTEVPIHIVLFRKDSERTTTTLCDPIPYEPSA